MIHDEEIEIINKLFFWHFLGVWVLGVGADDPCAEDDTCGQRDDASPDKDTGNEEF